MQSLFDVSVPSCKVTELPPLEKDDTFLDVMFRRVCFQILPTCSS